MLLRRPTTMQGTPANTDHGLKVVRMLECVSKEQAALLRANGFDMAVLTRNVYLVPEEAGDALLTHRGRTVPIGWARENLSRGLTPALRPTCGCGGFLNAGALDFDNDRTVTCSNCHTPTPTGQLAVRETVTEMYEASLSDFDDGFTLTIRDAPKGRRTKDRDSKRGGRWETCSLFCLAAVRLRSIGESEWKATDSSGRYPSQPYGWAYGATQSGKFGLVAVHPDRQADNVKHSLDPFALFSGIEAPVGIHLLYGDADGSTADE